MNARQQKFLNQMIERCRPLVDDGETVRVAWTGKKGIGTSNVVRAAPPASGLLVIFQEFRVIAVTDTHTYVFKSGWFTRLRPKKLMRMLPRAGAITTIGPGRWYEVGGERLHAPTRFQFGLAEAEHYRASG